MNSQNFHGLYTVFSILNNCRHLMPGVRCMAFSTMQRGKANPIAHPFYSRKITQVTQHVEISNVTLEELEGIIRPWMIAEGWNPSKHEMPAFFSADPNGYYLLRVNGRPAAALAGIGYSKEVAFLGLYLTDPYFRGFGYAKKLWDYVMSKLNSSLTIGLDGVMQQTENYQRSGFTPAYINQHYQGKAKLFNTGLKPIWKLHQLPSLSPLIDYDAAIFSIPRPEFLTKWLSMPEAITLVAIDGGKVVGYGVISASEQGFHTAPIFADNSEIATMLYQKLCASVPSDSIIHIDTPQFDGNVMHWAQGLELEPTFKTLRMYKGPFPKVQLSKVYGLTTIDIGLV